MASHNNSKDPKVSYKRSNYRLFACFIQFVCKSVQEEKRKQKSSSYTTMNPCGAATAEFDRRELQFLPKKIQYHPPTRKGKMMPPGAMPGMPQMPGAFGETMAKVTKHRRPPAVYEQGNIEGLFRFLVTVPLGFAACYIGQDVTTALSIWAIAYHVVVLLLLVLKLIKRLDIVNEITSSVSHMLAFLVCYVIMYNLLQLYK